MCVCVATLIDVTCSQDKATYVGHQLESQRLKLCEGLGRKTVFLGLPFLATVNFLLALCCSSCLGHKLQHCHLGQSPVRCHIGKELFHYFNRDSNRLPTEARQSVIPPATTGGNVIRIVHSLASNLQAQTFNFLRGLSTAGRLNYFCTHSQLSFPLFLVHPH